MVDAAIGGGPLEQQLNFYRHKVSQNEVERVEWQEASEQMRHNIERVHA